MSSSTAAVVLVVASAVVAVAFVVHRRGDARRLEDQAALVERLRALAGGDAVHRAAVDEFEVRIYRSLFAVGTVGPRVIAVTWATVGVLLGAAGTVLAAAGDGLGSMAILVVCAVATAVFAVLAVVHLVRTLYAVTALPRVTIDDIPGEDRDPA